MAGHKAQPQHVDREGAVATNVAVHREALERAAQRNNPEEPARDEDRDRAVRIAAGLEPRSAAQDATLNWGAGMTTATVGRSDIPFSSEHSRIAGVSAEAPPMDDSWVGGGEEDPAARLHKAWGDACSGMDAICNYGGRK